MKNEEWKKKNPRNDAPFVALYDMHAVSQICETNQLKFLPFIVWDRQKFLPVDRPI